MSGALVIEGYTKRFGDKLVLGDVDLTVPEGQFLVILGRSGGGKSTLLRSIGGLEEQYEGRITRPGSMSFGFQDARLLPWLHVVDNVTLGAHGDRDALRARAIAALDEVGLADRADVWPATLSGGQQQRVALARALFRQPALLLLDEPFGALDALTRLQAQDLVTDLWRQHELTAVLVTHDVEEAIILADRVVVLADTRIALDIPIDLPRPRDRRNPQFEDYRELLLAELGVSPVSG